MSEEKHKSMMIKLTLKHTLDGFDRVTIGIDVAPFGFPSIDHKRICTLGADNMKEGYEKMEIANTILQALFKLENLHLLRPEERVQSLESTTKRET